MQNKSLNLALALIILVGLIGFADASFLFYKYINADPINCLLFDGCNTVAQSPYSHFLGIPLPLFGMIFYTLMLGSSIFLLIKRTKFFAKIVLLFGVVGFIFSLYFIYLQGFIIQAFCIYCLLSALTSTTIFCITIYLQKFFKDNGVVGEANI